MELHPTRPTRRFNAGGLTFIVQQSSPREAFKAILALGATLGPGLAGLVTGAGVRLPTGGVIEWEELKAGGRVWEVIDLLLQRLEKVDPDKVLDLLDTLAVGHTWIVIPDAKAPLPVVNAEILDAYITDPLAMFGLFRFLLEVNARPTSPGGPAGQPGETTTTGTP